MFPRLPLLFLSVFRLPFRNIRHLRQAGRCHGLSHAAEAVVRQHDLHRRCARRIHLRQYAAACRRVLAEVYPACAAAVQVVLPDDRFRRVGQAVAAASLPEVPDVPERQTENR